MPAGQPFTQLCRTLARPRLFGRADLHLHTTSSDGTYRPDEIVDLARRSGLSAIAITDHDTTTAIAAARGAAGDALEVCAGVEISASYRNRELHLLGYFFDVDDAPLQAALARLRAARVERFHAMVDRLAAVGVRLPIASVTVPPDDGALGRRHLAELLVKERCVGTVREAFRRYLGDGCRVAVPKTTLPVAEAIARVRGAGGVASWAHPAYDCTADAVRELARLGLDALEVDFPGCSAGRGKQLRELASAHGLAVSGGSDCHGPAVPHATVGARGVSRDEYLTLKRRAASFTPGATVESRAADRPRVPGAETPPP